MYLNGEKDGALSYLSDLPSNGTIGFGDGWLYYTGGDEDDNNTIHRIRSDGTRDQIVTDNHSADRLCYQNGKVWFLERVSSESEFGKLEEQAYLMPVRESGNGEGTLTTEEDIVPLGEKHASWGLNIPNGWEFQYVINTVCIAIERFCAPALPVLVGFKPVQHGHKHKIVVGFQLGHDGVKHVVV